MRKYFVLFTLIAILAISASGWTFDPSLALNAIDSDLSMGKISVDQAVLYKAYALAKGSLLPSRYQNEQSISHWFCATPILISLKEDLAKVSPQAASEVKNIFWPTNQKGSVTKNGPKKSDNPQTIPLPNVVYTDHFALRYGNDHPGFEQSDVEAFGVVMETVWNIECNQWGYGDIYDSDLYYVDLYIANTGDGAPTMNFVGAYTTTYNDYMPYMVFHPQVVGSEEMMEDTGSHEFFHCNQDTIAAEGCFHLMNSYDNLWWIEGSAAWAEDEAYPDLNYYHYFIDPYAQSPEEALNVVTNNYNLYYSRVIFMKYLSENFGGRDSIYDILHLCLNTVVMQVEDYLQSNSSSLPQAYPDFMAHNIKKDYVDGAIYPNFKIHKTYSSYPVFQTVNSGATKPHFLGANNIKFNPPGSSDKINFYFHGQEELNNKPVEWAPVLLLDNSDSTYSVQPITLDSNKKGTVSINDFGGDIKKIYLIVAPISDRDADSTLNYHYQATLGDDPFAPEDDDTADDDIDDDATDDDAVDDDTTVDDDASADDDDSSPQTDDDQATGESSGNNNNNGCGC